MPEETTVKRFGCTTDNKADYYSIKEKINFHKGTILREKVRDLSSEFHVEFDVLIHGRSLYLELEESGLCRTIYLIPEIK